MTIRDARIEDSNEIAALSGELGYPAEAETARRRMEPLLAAPGSDAILVAEIAAEVVGWIHVAVIHSIENDPSAEIRGLVVTESHRGRGIGAQLVAAAERWAEARRLPRMRVRTNVTRERTHRFYERCGYVMSKAQRVYDKPLP